MRDLKGKRLKDKDEMEGGGVCKAIKMIDEENEAEVSVCYDRSRSNYIK